MNRYQNLDIELLDYHRGDEGESLRARVIASPAGEQRDADALAVAFPARLRERIKKLERRALSFDELIELGEALAALLLPPPVREIYRRCLAKLREDQGLRIRIRPHAPELAALPWEYAYVSRPDVPPGRKGPEGFLALDRKLSLVRYEIAGRSPTPIQPLEHYDIRAIALLAEVDEPAYAALDLDREELNLRQALEGTGGIDARFLRPGSRIQLEEMLGEDAQVFHFSGHGEVKIQMGEEPGTIEGEGQLILSSDENRADPVDAGTLALELKDKGIRLVVLNACEAAGRDPVTAWSGVASTLAQQGIPAVVGMQYTIRDGSAIAFSRRFYRALANGDSIDTAVSEGRLGILGRGGGEERDWGVPVLYMRGSRSVLFPPPIVPLRRNLALAIATIALLSIWFYLHIFPLVADGASRWLANLGLGAGAVAGLLAMGKVIGTFAAKTVKSEKGSRFDRWLRNRSAWGVLKTFFLASVLLFFTTHSIYLTHDDQNIDEIRLSVETEKGLSFKFLPILSTSITEERKLGGGPFLALPYPFHKLQLRVDQPDGWKLRANKGSISPTFLKPVNLLASDIFLNPKDLRVLRIAPGKFLFQILPEVDQQTESPYQLKITIDGESFNIDNYRQGVVVAGGPAALLKERIKREGPSDRNASLKDCVGGAGESENKMLSKLNSNIEFLDTPIINTNSSITMEVIGLPASLPFKFSKSIKPESLSVKAIDTKCLEGQRK